MPAVLLASGDTQVQAQQNGDLVVVTVPSLQRLGVTLRPAAAPPSPPPGDRYARSDSFSSGPRRRRSPSFRRSPPARRSRSPSRPPVSLVRRSRSPPPPARPTSPQPSPSPSPAAPRRRRPEPRKGGHGTQSHRALLHRKRREKKIVVVIRHAKEVDQEAGGETTFDLPVRSSPLCRGFRLRVRVHGLRFDWFRGRGSR